MFHLLESVSIPLNRFVITVHLSSGTHALHVPTRDRVQIRRMRTETSNK